MSHVGQLGVQSADLRLQGSLLGLLLLDFGLELQVLRSKHSVLGLKSSIVLLGGLQVVEVLELFLLQLRDDLMLFCQLLVKLVSLRGDLLVVPFGLFEILRQVLGSDLLFIELCSGELKTVLADLVFALKLVFGGLRVLLQLSDLVVPRLPQLLLLGLKLISKSLHLRLVS